MNIRKAHAFAGDFLHLEEAERVRERLDTLASMVEARSKSIRWKLRSIIGDRMRWYREVEEVERG
jgi:hypothetical protein